MSESREVNRRNSLRSTGPKTAEGKAIVSANATRHGLLARLTVLPTENAEEFRAFARGLRESLAPATALEGFLADKVLGEAWRLCHARRIETERLALHRKLINDRNDRRQADDKKRAMNDPTITAESTEEEIDQALASLVQPYRDVIDAATFDSAAPELEVAARYEATIERRFYRALAELERLQAGRRGDSSKQSQPTRLQREVGESD